jgi:adenosyl cobinamide kinase/adenosyl cobinamide phosphate guanylyltransferase
MWLKFAEIDHDAFRLFVATGATDDEVAAWIGEHAKKRSSAEVIVWNNQQPVSPPLYSCERVCWVSWSCIT